MNRYIGIYRRCELHYIREELEKYGLTSLEGRLIPLMRDKCVSQEELCCMMNLDKGLSLIHILSGITHCPQDASPHIVEQREGDSAKVDHQI